MATKKQRQLYADCKGAVHPVIFKDKLGDERIGTAFHVGDGFFVSAKHLFENTTEWRLLVRDEFSPYSMEGEKRYALSPKLSPNELLDIAVFSIPELSNLPAVELGGHLDDWIDDDAFILESVLLLGYPPIPMTNEPYLVAVAGEINALVVVRNSGHFQFIISTTPRGGFSGGVAMIHNFGLGLITTSLTRDDLAAENGFMAVLTIEPILVCLGLFGMIPQNVRDVFGGLFDP